MYCAFLLSIYIIGRGKPTRLAPKPKPAPCRAAWLIEGANMSNMAKTAAAVKKFKMANGLPQDSIVGPKVWAKLFS